MNIKIWGDFQICNSVPSTVFQRTAYVKLWLLKFQEVQYYGSFFCLSLLIIHVIGLNFINHKAKDYFPGGTG